MSNINYMLLPKASQTIMAYVGIQDTMLMNKNASNMKHSEIKPGKNGKQSNVTLVYNYTCHSKHTG